ncbi:plexin domain-containing protein 2 [Trichonephila clavipes]|nr:plexin domain-containing protein 2 [Trichonephila clavipes]
MTDVLAFFSALCCRNTRACERFRLETLTTSNLQRPRNVFYNNLTSIYFIISPFFVNSPYKPYTLIPQIPKSDHPFETSTITHVPYKPGQNDDGASTSARVAEESSSMGVGTVVAVLLILAIVMGGLVWVGYAYKNPHTSSGQLLIRYRPSQWRFRSGEARYTAASVHM